MITCDKAVQEAVQIGTLNPSNSEAVKTFRITVPKPELPTVIEKEERTTAAVQSVSRSDLSH